ncbi:hypothetical protein M9Y10_028127 [Tritrichomonas musculus]|uniref:Potassium channel domain-containing protein n=1 Tax=Tritrichomonas musculus TaxID=1915356 RepID=A0ABR2KKF9_9EUKA
MTQSQNEQNQIQKFEVTRGGIKTVYNGDRNLYSLQFVARDFRQKCRKQYTTFVIIQFIFSCLSIAISLIQMEIARNAQNTDKMATVQLLVIINIIVCGLNFFIIVFRINIKYYQFRVRTSYPIDFIHFLFLRNKALMFFLEIVFNWIIPYSTNPEISNWINILMMFKLYPIVIINNCFSSINKNKLCITQNLESFNLPSPSYGTVFYLKYIIQVHGAMIIGGMYAILILFFAYLFYSSNKPSNQLPIEETRDYNFLQTIYWAIITTTTVGYGDLGPVGHFQRAIAIILVFLGVILTSLIMGFVTTWMQMQENEVQALRIAERKVLVSELDKWAARVIQYSYRIKKYHGSEPTTNALLNNKRFMELQRHLLQALTKVQDIQRTLNNEYNFDPTKKSNDEPDKLIRQANVLDDYHYTLDHQIDYLNEEISTLLTYLKIQPVKFMDDA